MFLLTWKSRVGFFRTKMLLTQTAHNTCLHRRRTGNFFQCAVRRIVSQPGQKEEVLYIVRTVCVKWPLIVMFSSFFSEDSLIILLFCFHLACLICHNICPKGLFYITQQKTHQPVTPLLVLSRGRAWHLSTGSSHILDYCLSFSSFHWLLSRLYYHFWLFLACIEPWTTLTALIKCGI